MELDYFQKSNFTLPEETKDSLKSIKLKLKNLIINPIKTHAPKQKFGILFSGGIDSVLIAFICKQLKLDFVCYTSAVSDPNLAEAQDLVWAKKAAEELGFKLKIKKIGLNDTEEYIKKIIKIINDSNVVKVGVALPLFLAMEQAKKDGIRVMFSGLGSEELFAGYERHVKAGDINQECVNGLNNIYERDLTRDISISKANNIELKLPFLEKDIIDYSLSIPSKYKIKNNIKKYILRLVAQDIGVNRELAFRPKKAAQYGSKFDRAIEILSKKKGFKKKSDYLNTFNPNPKLGALISSGKDSIYAMYLMKKQGYIIKCLITLKSKNQDSFMFHTPNVGLVKLQSEATGIPLLEHETKGEEEKELKDLKEALEKAKKQFNIEGIVTGALFSEYQKNRIDKIASELGLKSFAPLWHMEQETELRSILKSGFEIIISSVAAEGLDKSWLGRPITEKDVDKLVEINKKIGINIAFEGGEAETLVLNCPMFHKKIEILDSEIIEENKNTARLVIKKAKLI